MPELPEVEILVRHLQPLLKGKTIRTVKVHRSRSVRPDTRIKFAATLEGVKITDVTRRAKYLIFDYTKTGQNVQSQFLGHLGMTGRMYLQKKLDPLPNHAVVSFDLGRFRFVFEDTRHFGRMTLDMGPLEALGPEPQTDDFTIENFEAKLSRSSRPIKTVLMDQSVVAGIGNIYASEALFEARISPVRKSNHLTGKQIQKLHSAIRKVLADAIELGSTISLSWKGSDKNDGLFYFGSDAKHSNPVIERFRVYGREGESCNICGKSIHRIVQSNRGTFFCPKCQC